MRAAVLPGRGLPGSAFLKPSKTIPTDGDPTLLSLVPLQTVFGIELIVFLIVLLLLPLIIFIIVAVWMYQDANARGMNGGIWVIILVLASLIGSFIGGIIVVIIYLLLREGHLSRGPYSYPYPPPGYGYAGYPPAGYPPPAAPPGTAGCPRCGAMNNPSARFCVSCGFQLHA